MPIPPALPHCHRSIAGSRGCVASFRLQEKGSQAPHPGQRPARLPQHRAWPPPSLLLASGGAEAPSRPGPSLQRGRLDWKGVLVTEQRCEGGIGRSSLCEGLELPMC